MSRIYQRYADDKSVSPEVRKAWHIDYRQPDGRRIREKIGPKAEAERRLMIIKGEIAKGTFDHTAILNDKLDTPISVLIDEYVEATRPYLANQDSMVVMMYLKDEFGCYTVRTLTPKILRQKQLEWLNRKNGAIVRRRKK